MGFFKKVFKGVGKVFRKIGRGLKKVVGKFGKFMGKIGIVGQIGLSLLLPGIGEMFGTLAGSLMKSSSMIIKGAGNVLNAAVNVGTKVGSTFKTITEGVTKVMGEVATAGLDKLGLSDSTFGKFLAEKGFTGDIGGAFTDSVSGVKASVGDLFSSSTLTSPNQYLQGAATQLAQKPLEAVSSDLTEKLTGVAGDTSFGVEDVLQPIEVTAQRIPTEPTSLLDPLVKGVKELPGKAVEAAEDFVADVPGKVAEAATSGIESTIKTGIAQAAGIKTTPEYNITNVSGYVPTIDMSGTSDIGATPAQFDAVAYMQNNVDTFNMNPYGFNAAVYNAGAYQKRMAQYGFAV